MGRIFFGGIHPAPRKRLTKKKPLADLDQPPAEVVLPMDLSTGAPAIPVVKVGQKVLWGELIAQADGEDSAPIHASVSGTVIAIEERPHPFGGESLSVVIENDRNQTPCPLEKPEDAKALSQEEILNRIRQSGVVGMGGDPIPTHIKILSARGKIDTLIIDAVECEPYLTSDHRLLLERSRQVLQGVGVLARVLGVDRTILVSQSDKLNVIEQLEHTMELHNFNLKLRTIPSQYPLGAEKVLIRAVTGREVPPGGTASDAACVIFHAATAYAVGQAVYHGRPLTHRAVTVTGGCVVRPRNLWVPIGTPLSDLLQSTNGLKDTPDLIFLGGPMTGVTQGDLNVPILKNTGGLVCITAQERVRTLPQEECLQCGHCVATCPMQLSPVFIHRAVKGNDLAALTRLNATDCIECGCCSYCCPCHIRLADVMRSAKTLLEEGGTPVET